MTAADLKAKIAADHDRLREQEAQVATLPAHERRQYDALLRKARADLTQLEIKLAGMREVCPACGDEIPNGFLVCEVCMREVSFKLYAAWKGARGIAHAFAANKRPPADITTAQANESRARAAILSHLKQYGSGAGLLAA